METLQRPPLSKWEQYLEWLFIVAGGIALMGMMFHVVADVMMKYFMNSPIVGTLEVVANYYMVAIVFLPLSLVHRSGGHVKVEIFTTVLPQRFVNALEMFATILTLVFVGLLGWFVFQEALAQTAIWEKIQVGSDYLSVWPARWLAPIGVFAFILALLVSLRADFNRLRGREGAINSGLV